VFVSRSDMVANLDTDCFLNPDATLSREKSRTRTLRVSRHADGYHALASHEWRLETGPSYSLSHRDLEEIMAERSLAVDHVTIWRWVQRCAPVLNQRMQRELRRANGSWRVDET